MENVFFNKETVRIDRKETDERAAKIKRLRIKMNGQLWRPDKFHITKHMREHMAFLGDS